MTVAGYIHDLGKLAMPAEILEKPAPLTREEFNVIRTHTFYTDHILKSLHGFDTIRKWGALHHERLDGSGYPFHLEGKDLPTGSRILSVADVFVALTENRPYRRGLKRHEVLPVLENMVRKTALDCRIVELLEDGFEKINATRIEAHYRAEEEYQRFARQALMLRECRGRA
jgi:HD-GYP domain-containing protein (c-di-GMP phosphodiesterase class II)